MTPNKYSMYIEANTHLNTLKENIIGFAMVIGLMLLSLHFLGDLVTAIVVGGIMALGWAFILYLRIRVRAAGIEAIQLSGSFDYQPWWKIVGITVMYAACWYYHAGWTTVVVTANLAYVIYQTLYLRKQIDSKVDIQLYPRT